MPAQKKILNNIKDKPYFLKDNFVLYKNDCLKILEQLPENSIDMIFADPPYNLSNGGFTVHAGRQVSESCLESPHFAQHVELLDRNFRGLDGVFRLLQ